MILYRREFAPSLCAHNFAKFGVRGCGGGGWGGNFAARMFLRRAKLCAPGVEGVGVVIWMGVGQSGGAVGVRAVGYSCERRWRSPCIPLATPLDPLGGFGVLQKWEVAIATDFVRHGKSLEKSIALNG